MKTIKTNPGYFNGFTRSDRFALARNGVESFTVMWNSLLANLDSSLLGGANEG